MIVEVYHGDTHVATVSAPDYYDVDHALEFAFRWTQNIDGSWSRYGNADWHPNVKVRAPLPIRNGKEYGLRSSSMGDRMHVGDDIYTVAAFGFEKTGVKVRP